MSLNSEEDWKKSLTLSCSSLSFHLNSEEDWKGSIQTVIKGVEPQLKLRRGLKEEHIRSATECIKGS